MKRLDRAEYTTRAPFGVPRIGRPADAGGARRLLPALILAALIALVPLTVLADLAFLDLGPASPHDDNIAAINAAGVTKGCCPGRLLHAGRVPGTRALGLAENHAGWTDQPAYGPLRPPSGHILPLRFVRGLTGAAARSCTGRRQYSAQRRTQGMAQKTAKGITANQETAEGFTAEERAAMQERAKEVTAGRRRPRAGKPDGEQDVLAKIAEMAEPDRSMAERLHAIIKASAPDLAPKTWYGMPAYAKDGKVVCFFQPAQKFGTRYATFGFNDIAHLDDGSMWPTAFALTALTAADEARIGELVKQALG
jgi:uncharacterized protein YdhG (YjbR/CyaY superfamily)